MKIAIRTLLVTFLLVCFPLHMQAAAASAEMTDFYQNMSQLSNDALQKKALRYIHVDKDDSAFVCYSIMANRLEMQQMTDDDLLKCVMALNNLGYMYYFCYYDYQKSFRYLTLALQASEKYSQEQAQEAIYLNFAHLYQLYSDYFSISDYSDKIISYYKKAFYVARKFGDDRAMLVSFYGLLHYAYWAGKTSVVKKEMHLIRTTRISVDYPMVRLDRDFCDAVDSIEAHNYAAALKSLQAMIRHNNARDTPERYDIMVNQCMADICIKMKAYRQAETCLAQAEQLAVKHQSKDLLVYVYKDYVNLYARMQDEVRKETYETKFLRSKDRLMNEGKLKTVEKMHFMQELDKVNVEVVNLHHERQRQHIVFLAVLAVAFVLIVSVVVLTRNYRKLKASYVQLYRRNVEMLEQEDKKQRHLQQKDKSGTVAVDNDKEEKQQQATAADESLRKLQTVIEEVLNNSKEIYTMDFDLTRLADLTNVKYWTLSKGIKELYGKNFNALLGEYRIMEACRRLNDLEHYRNYSIEGIALSVGFKSRPNFVNVFKTVVGMTPTEYKKIAMDVRK